MSDKVLPPELIEMHRLRAQMETTHLVMQEAVVSIAAVLHHHQMLDVPTLVKVLSERSVDLAQLDDRYKMAPEVVQVLGGRLLGEIGGG